MLATGWGVLGEIGSLDQGFRFWQSEIGSMLVIAPAEDLAQEWVRISVFCRAVFPKGGRNGFGPILVFE